MTGFLVLFGSECHHAATAEEAADLLSRAGGQVATIVRLDQFKAVAMQHAAEHQAEGRERAAVVLWLRTHRRHSSFEHAEAIENGEHRRAST